MKVFTEIKNAFKTNRLLQVLTVIAVVLGVVHFSLIIWQPYFQEFFR